MCKGGGGTAVWRKDQEKGWLIYEDAVRDVGKEMETDSRKECSAK